MTPKILIFEDHKNFLRNRETSQCKKIKYLLQIYKTGYFAEGAAASFRVRDTEKS